jgi:hypothetical protein
MTGSQKEEGGRGAMTLGSLLARLVDQASGARPLLPEDREALAGLLLEGTSGGRREAVAAVQGELRAWTAVLAQVQSSLLRGAEAIEPSSREMDPEVDLDVMDEPTKVRSVIRNVAENYLRPAIEDLRGLL